MRKILSFAFVTVTVLFIAGLRWRQESRRRNLPTPAWLAWFFENPLIERVSGVETTLDRIGLRPGERCLDVGSGPGRLAIPAARRVGPAGSVVAMDIQPAMLVKLQRRAARAGLANIEPHPGDIATDGILASNSFDRAWLVTVLGEIPDRQAALRNIYRVLKPGGFFTVTEMLPDPHFQRRETVLRLAEAAGFKPIHHWGSVFAFTQSFVKPA